MNQVIPVNMDPCHIQVTPSALSGLQTMSPDDQQAFSEACNSLQNHMAVVLARTYHGDEGVALERVVDLRREVEYARRSLHERRTFSWYVNGPLRMTLLIAGFRDGVPRIQVVNFQWCFDVDVIRVAPAVAAPRTPPRPAARRTTAWAVRVAGPRRAHLQSEWVAVLAGAPEDGMAVPSRQQLRLALGFFGAAVRMRAHDAARPAWRPVDWILRTESRTNGLITLTVGAQAVYIIGDDGLSALVVEVWEPCGIAGAALFVLARWLRRVRGIELASATHEAANE